MPDTTTTDAAAAPALFVPKLRTNVQVTRIQRHFGNLDAADATFPPALRFVLVCFTPRCGSTYLAQLIASGGLYNQPREYLNFSHVIKRSNKRGLSSFAGYFDELLRVEARQNRIFIKVTPRHLGLLAEAGLLARIVGQAEFVLVERSDKLAQAISFAIARQTGKFTSNMPSRKTEAELAYRREPIARLLTDLAGAYRQFDLFFGMNGIVPVHVVYEHLVAQPAATLKLISERLGLPDFVVKAKKIRNARQASTVNAAWRAEFLGASGAAPAEDSPPEA